MIKSKFTKSFALMLTALLLLSMIIFCVACNQTPEVPDTETPDTENPDQNTQDDPYAGDYKLVSDNERQEFVARILQKIENLNESNSIANYKVNYYSKVEHVDDEEYGQYTFDMLITVNENKKFVELKFDQNNMGEEISKFDINVWINGNEDIYFEITIDGKSIRGKYTGNEDVKEIKMAMHLILTMPDWKKEYLSFIMDAITQPDNKIYKDNDKLKILIDADDSFVETYCVFEGNNTFRCKFVGTEIIATNGIGNTIQELIPTDDEVIMPNFD